VREANGFSSALVAPLNREYMAAGNPRYNNGRPRLPKRRAIDLRDGEAPGRVEIFVQAGGKLVD
jgi:hypothetical protein